MDIAFYTLFGTLHLYRGLINDTGLVDTKKFLINLDKRKDRLKITKNLLEKYGYGTDLNRFPAIEGIKVGYSNPKIIKQDPSVINTIINKKRTEHHQLSIGAIGCYLSHLNIWKKLQKDHKHNHYLIFEDDTLPTIQRNDMNKLLKQVPDDWDIILFGGMYNKGKKDEPFVKCTYFYCLHAYLINKNKLDMLISEALPMTMQIDSWMSLLIKEGRLNVYGINNSSWVQNTEGNLNKTDIQTPVTI